MKKCGPFFRQMMHENRQVCIFVQFSLSLKKEAAVLKGKGNN
jgi:hypothetical protein